MVISAQLEIEKDSEEAVSHSRRITYAHQSSWGHRDDERGRKLAEEIGQLAERGRKRHRKKTHSKPEDFSVDIVEFIEEIIPKYAELEDPQSKNAMKRNGRHFSKHFQFHRSELIPRQVPEEGEKQYHQSYIEYRYFLGSLYGSKFSPASTEEFKEVVNEDGALIPSKMAEVLSRDRKLFGLNPVAGDLSLEERFNNYVEYRISTHFKFASDPAPIRNKARDATREAIIKYGINEGNLDNYLKLVLQHTDWGLSQGYREVRTDKITEMERASQ